VLKTVFGQNPLQGLTRMVPGLSQDTAAKAAPRLGEHISLSEKVRVKGGLREVQVLVREGQTEKARERLSELLALGEMRENGSLDAPVDVTDVLDLTRLAHGLSLDAQAVDGLQWATELLRDARGRGDATLTQMRDGDRIATLALAIGKKDQATAALSLVRKQPEIDRHIQRLEKGVTRRNAPLADAKTVDAAIASQKEQAPFGVRREQKRLEILRSGARQSVKERLQLLDAIQGGRVPLKEGLQLLKEGNPHLDGVLSFAQECARVNPSIQGRDVDLGFVLEEGVLDRTSSLQLLAVIFRMFGTPREPKLTDMFLAMHPEFKPVEHVRQIMANRLNGTALGQGVVRMAAEINDETALLSFLERSLRCVLHPESTDNSRWLERWMPDDSYSLANLVSPHSDELTASLAHRYAWYLAADAREGKLSGQDYKVVDISQGFMRDAEAYLKQAFPNIKYKRPVKKLASDNSDGLVTQREHRRFGMVDPTATDVTRMVNESVQDILIRAKDDPDSARTMLQRTVELPESYWRDQNIEHVLPLMRIADHRGWIEERDRLFKNAVALVRSDADRQELAWLGRMMGVDDPRLAKNLDREMGRRLVGEFLSDAPDSEQAMKRLLETEGVFERDKSRDYRESNWWDSLDEDTEYDFWLKLKPQDPATDATWLRAVSDAWVERVVVPTAEGQKRAVLKALNGLSFNPQSESDNQRLGGLVKLAGRILEPVLSDADKVLFKYDPWDEAAGRIKNSDDMRVRKASIAPITQQRAEYFRRVLGHLIHPDQDIANPEQALYWAVKQGMPPEAVANDLLGSLPSPHQALARYLGATEWPFNSKARTMQALPKQFSRQVFERLQQPLSPNATPLSELRWLTGLVANGTVEEALDASTKALLNAWANELNGHNKYLAESSVRLLDNNVSRKDLLRRIADGNLPPLNRKSDAWLWLHQQYGQDFAGKYREDGKEWQNSRRLFQEIQSSVDDGSFSQVERSWLNAFLKEFPARGWSAYQSPDDFPFMEVLASFMRTLKDVNRDGQQSYDGLADALARVNANTGAKDLRRPLTERFWSSWQAKSYDALASAYGEGVSANRGAIAEAGAAVSHLPGFSKVLKDTLTQADHFVSVPDALFSFRRELFKNGLLTRDYASKTDLFFSAAILHRLRNHYIETGGSVAAIKFMNDIEKGEDMRIQAVQQELDMQFFARHFDVALD